MEGNSRALDDLARRELTMYLEEIQQQRLKLTRMKLTTEDERALWLMEVSMIDALIDWVNGVVRPTDTPEDSPGQVRIANGRWGH